MKKVRCFSLLMLICMISAVAFAQNVNVDWMRGTDFSKFKTYAWGVSPRPVNDPLWHQRVIDNIDGALAGKGLQKVDINANPDMIVVYSAGIRQNVSYQGYAMGWWNRTGSISQVVENEGTLIVDLADPRQKTILWRGTATETLSDKSDKNIQKLQKMVSKMFQKYPPTK